MKKKNQLTKISNSSKTVFNIKNLNYFFNFKFFYYYNYFYWFFGNNFTKLKHNEFNFMLFNISFLLEKNFILKKLFFFLIFNLIKINYLLIINSIFFLNFNSLNKQNFLK